MKIKNLKALKSGNTNKMFELNEKVAFNWKGIGWKLGMSDKLLDGFEQEHQQDERRLEAVWKEWLRAQSHYPFTWEGLHRLLRDCDQGGVFEQHIEFFHTMC